MTERTCRTCRHWDGYDDGESWGGCWLAATDAEGEAVESVSLASAMATHATGAQLVTAPDFGCVQWTRREPDGTDGWRPRRAAARGRPPTTRRSARPRWTAAEDALLREHAALTVGELAVLLGHPAPAVERRGGRGGAGRAGRTGGRVVGTVGADGQRGADTALPAAGARYMIVWPRVPLDADYGWASVEAATSRTACWVGRRLLDSRKADIDERGRGVHLHSTARRTVFVS